jgi:hypothetical protein
VSSAACAGEDFPSENAKSFSVLLTALKSPCIIEIVVVPGLDLDVLEELPVQRNQLSCFISAHSAVVVALSPL